MTELVESGTIVVTDRDENRIRKALREWTNSVHAAVMFEIDALGRGLGNAGADLTELAARVSDARARWSTQSEPALKVLINMLAVRALEGHLEDCASTTGRLRTVEPTVLAELLPKRTAKAEYFRTPGLDGEARAGITLRDGEFTWCVESRDASSAEAKDSPLARIAFGLLDRAEFPEGYGGEIVDDAGRVTAVYG